MAVFVCGLGFQAIESTSIYTGMEQGSVDVDAYNYCGNVLIKAVHM